MKQFAIFHGFDDMHYEMLGYAIEYCLNKNSSFTIYAYESSRLGREWKEWYDCFVIAKWHDPSTFNGDNYHNIILLTDDDRNFQSKWALKFSKKIICINHVSEIRLKNMLVYIQTRPTSNGATYSLPSYIAIKKECKNIIDNKINIAIVGDGHRYHDPLRVLSMFKNNNIVLHIICYKIAPYYHNIDRIKCYEYLNATDMFKILQKCKFMMCLPVTFKNYINSSMSGAIPLAFSTGCQLIIPQEWQEVYKFKSAIPYTMNDTIMLQNVNLDDVYNELNEQILHRNTVFDASVEIVKQNKKIL